MHRRMLSLSGLAAGVILAGLALSSRPAFAKGAPSPLAGVSNISVTLAGPQASACTLTGPSSLLDISLTCSGPDPASEGSPTCVCTEFTGVFKGTQIGSGVFTFDVITDESGHPGTLFPIPGIGAEVDCNAATIVGLMQKGSAKGPIVATFNGAGQLCPPVPLPSPFGAPIPGGFNGTFVITDTTTCPAIPEAFGGPAACLLPKATGAGNLAGEVIPGTSPAPNQVRLTMTGQFKNK